MNDSIPHKTKITTSLGTFEFEGSQEFVESQIQKIVDIISATPVVPKEVLSQESSQPGAIKKAPSKKSLTEQPQMLPNLITDGSKIAELREFYTAKSAQTQVEIFAVLAYWLKSSCQITEVSINEMWTLYKILNIKPPKILIQTFRDGKSKKAYFEAGTTTGKYYLTPYGETFVEHDLPVKSQK